MFLQKLCRIFFRGNHREGPDYPDYLPSIRHNRIRKRRSPIHPLQNAQSHHCSHGLHGYQPSNRMLSETRERPVFPAAYPSGLPPRMKQSLPDVVTMTGDQRGYPDAAIGSPSSGLLREKISSHDLHYLPNAAILVLLRTAVITDGTVWVAVWAMRDHEQYPRLSPRI